MRNKHHILVLLVLALAGSVACTKTASDHTPPEVRSLAEIRFGDFEKSVRELYAMKFAEDCDHKNLDRVAEIAAYLDQNQAGFTKLSDPEDGKPDSAPPTVEKVRIGDFTLLRPLQMTENTAADEYEFAEPWSWNGIYEDFLKVKSNPTRSAALRLLSSFQALLVDDEDRINLEKNLGLDHRAIQNLPPFLDSLEDCLKKPNCLFPNWPDDLKAWAESVPYYNQYLKKFKKGTFSLEQSREWLGKLRKWVRYDKMDVSPNANDTIRKGPGDSLIVPLRSDQLGEAAPQLDPFLLSDWNEAGLSVVIEWIKEPLINIYQVLFSKQVSGRPFVSYSKRTLNLFERNNTRAVTHEFGHVLGLPDEYFTVWNEESCEYKDEINKASIMSVSRKGRVLPRHLEAIRRLYLE